MTSDLPPPSPPSHLLQLFHARKYGSSRVAHLVDLTQRDDPEPLIALTDVTRSHLLYFGPLPEPILTPFLSRPLPAAPARTTRASLTSLILANI